MMKRLFLSFLAAAMSMSIFAQQPVVVATDAAPRMPVSDILQQWDRETLLDSLDQERLPRIVTTGVMLNGNISNFIITRAGNTLSSYMRVGVEAGGFVDFCLSKHFGIQPQLLITGEQNRFSVSGQDANGLWQVGMDIPIYFLGRFGNMQQGYLQFGGGLFTHFTFASDVGRPIVITGDGQSVEKEQKELQRGELQDEYTSLLKLHNNHFGICATIGYEFPIGIQINAAYRVSLSDICSFYMDNTREDATDEQRQLANAAIYPQKITLGLAYRFRSKAERKQKTKK